MPSGNSPFWMPRDLLQSFLYHHAFPKGYGWCVLQVSAQIFTSGAKQHQNNLHTAKARFSQWNWGAQHCCSIIHYHPLPKSSVPPFWMQRVLTRQTLGVGVPPFQDFASFLFLLDPSEAAKTLHELQHAPVWQQLSLMPGVGIKKKSAQGAKRGVAYTKSPGVRK